jgi:transposase InsO family protein
MPVVAMNAEIAIHFVKMAEAMLGNYEKILSDSRPYFTSNIFKRWCEKKCVELNIATPAHPEANGCCERFSRTFQQ